LYHARKRADTSDYIQRTGISVVSDNDSLGDGEMYVTKYSLLSRVKMLVW